MSKEAKTKLLTCPPGAWDDSIPVTSKQIEVVKFMAKQMNLIFKETDKKVFVGLSDRSEVAKNPQAPKEDITSTPYYSQRDSKVPGQWWRSCFSSSCAMLLQTLKPGTLVGGKNADDQYLRRVRTFGDTTQDFAQIAALNYYGVKARLVKTLDWPDVDKELKKGRPVPIGILHSGGINYPTGDGHWVIVIGKSGKNYVVHDPYGELDLLGGTYLNANGNFQRYSRKNLGRRWMAGHVIGRYEFTPGSGWGILVDSVDGVSVR